MRILVSNDDGYCATGIRVLVDALSKDHAVSVVAPDKNRSGVSNALTLDAPIYIKKHAPHAYAVDGTPADCMQLALHGLLSELPDIVVSGINAGSNLGDDTLYSGTVAAAINGRKLRLPPIAVSLCVRNGKKLTHFATAARVLCELLPSIVQLKGQGKQIVLNVNVPDIPYAALRGIRITRLGKRDRSEQCIATVNPRGRRAYWLGKAGKAVDAAPDTDFYAVAHDYVSITPLSTVYTHSECFSSLEKIFT